MDLHESFTRGGSWPNLDLIKFWKHFFFFFMKNFGAAACFNTKPNPRCMFQVQGHWYKIDLQQIPESSVLKIGPEFKVWSWANNHQNLSFDGSCEVMSIWFAEFDLPSSQLTLFSLTAFPSSDMVFHWSVFSAACFGIATWSQQEHVPGAAENGWR